MVSVSLHVLAVLLIVGVESGMLAELFGVGGGIGPAGGGGGGGIRYVALPAYVPSATSSPRSESSNAVRFVPTDPSVRTIPASSRAVDADWPMELVDVLPRPGSDRGVGGGPGRGPGSGGGEGRGLGTGIGDDVGPGTGGNRGYVYAPEPRAIHYPIQTAPTSIQGLELSIHFWVDAQGRVTKVEIDPPIDDRDYREALLDTLMGWVFYPARTASGAPVAGEMVITHRP